MLANMADDWRPQTSQTPGSSASRRTRSSRASNRQLTSLGSLPELSNVTGSLPELSNVTRSSPGPPTRAMNRMVDHMVQRKAVVSKMFLEYDTDRSGSIDADELGAALRDLGLKLSPEELAAVFTRLDSDGSGEVDLAEFMHHFKQEQKKRFEGHVPELKEAKDYLISQLKNGGQLHIDGGAGLYNLLVQIEQLQAAEGLSLAEVAELRRYIRELLKRGMVLGKGDKYKLRQAVRLHAPQPQPTHARPWRNGSWELPGPRLVRPGERVTKRLSTGQWEKKRWQLKNEPVHSHTYVTNRPKEQTIVNNSQGGYTSTIPNVSNYSSNLEKKVDRSRSTSRAHRTQPSDGSGSESSPFKSTENVVKSVPQTPSGPQQDDNDVLGDDDGTVHHIGLWRSSSTMKKAVPTNLSNSGPDRAQFTVTESSMPVHNAGRMVVPGNIRSQLSGEFARVSHANNSVTGPGGSGAVYTRGHLAPSALFDATMLGSVQLAKATHGNGREQDPEQAPPSTPSVMDVSRFLR